MIQRIQTLYLLLTGICLGLTFVFPYAEFPEGQTLNNFGAFLAEGPPISDTLLGFPLAFIVVFIIAMVIFSIANFKKRKFQLTLCWTVYIAILALVICVYKSADHLASSMGLQGGQISYQASTYLPIIALVFVFLAKRGIKKDEILVNSQDRLR